ncbi:TetR/AcrR family transcriptional regulator [Nocardia iowensis]|uniref:TetR/AcrR family transcriptional regulator n=1 Tax=Nocardia iowensis TaxID=204891 RepID=UPI001FE80493|nr:TetR/AcrR family transcriptional regulator [Nocardia iowensis]
MRAALIEASFEILAEAGLAGFSVAKVAKLVGVSSGAPYRHFGDRDALLNAVAEQASLEAVERIGTAVEAAGADPILRLSACAGAYVGYVITRGPAIDAIFAADLQREREGRLNTASQAALGMLRGLVSAAGGADSDTQFEQYLAMVNGYVALYEAGFFHATHYNAENIAAHAAHAVATLAAGWRSMPGLSPNPTASS